ncbi:MAG: hypothetical protein U0791_21840 [Gemmataceae bacterium]
MIVALNRESPELKEFVVDPTPPEERVQNLKDMAECSRNLKWFGEHAKEIRDQHSGKYIVILGQELFVGDDAREVYARAEAAHPDLNGAWFAMRLSRHRGPKVY